MYYIYIILYMYYIYVIIYMYYKCIYIYIYIYLCLHCALLFDAAVTFHLFSVV